MNTCGESCGGNDERVKRRLNVVKPMTTLARALSVAAVVLMILVITPWSFFMGVRALTPYVLLFVGWWGGTTNGSMRVVLVPQMGPGGCYCSTNGSRGFVDHLLGGAGSGTLFPIGQAASFVDLASMPVPTF